MSKGADYFNMAFLSEASYVDFTPSNGYSDLVIGAALQDRDRNGRFTEAQASNFVSTWRILHHQPDTDSGFSATLFQHKTTGRYVLGFRGTADWDDLIITDGSDIVLDGLAIDQIVDMYNYWQRLVTPEGQTYQAACLEILEEESAGLAIAKAGQFVPGSGLTADAYLEWLYSRTDIVIDNGVGETVRAIKFVPSDEAFSDAQQYGVGGSDWKLDTGGVDVTGHSLGGHLAVAFTRLFHDVGAVAVTINGAGFATGGIPGIGGDAGINVRNLFGTLTGHQDRGFPGDRIWNLYGDKAPEFVTMDSYFGLQQQGAHQPVYIEDVDVIGASLGHNVSQITDALAVYDLFIDLDSRLGAEGSEALMRSLLHLFNASATDPLDTYEYLVNGLGDIFQAGDAIAVAGDREQLHRRISDIRESEAFDAACRNASVTLFPLFEVGNHGRVEPLSAENVANAALDNNDGLAYRYALVNVLPFAVIGEPGLFDAHNANGELDLFDEETGRGALTKQYLADRAIFLEKRISFVAIDTELKTIQPENVVFEDRQFDISLTEVSIGGASGESRRLTFGSDADESGETRIEGGARNDHLYGEGGNDEIIGNDGDDYLEGGAGNDKLAGGANDDTILGGEGKDDIDGGRGSDHIDGGVGIDHLAGGAQNDTLFGGQGDDVLEGGPGLLDRLEGGEGRDRYIYRSGDDGFILKDSDGEGEVVVFDGAGNFVVAGQAPIRPVAGAPGLHEDAHGLRYLLIETPGLPAGSGELMIVTPDAGTILIEGFQDGALGIHLESVGAPPATGSVQQLEEMPGQNQKLSGDGLVSVQGSAVADLATLDYVFDPVTGYDYSGLVVSGEGGDDNIAIGHLDGSFYAGGANPLPPVGTLGAIVSGGEGADTVNGSLFDDRLDGGPGHDALFDQAGSDVLVGGDGNDLLDGDSVFDALDGARYGRDLLFGGNDSDYLLGGGEGDQLFGGDGADYLYGDTSSGYVSWDGDLAQLRPTDFGSENQPEMPCLIDVLPDRAGNDLLRGGDGDDFLYGGGARDSLHGEAGSDVLQGEAGDDLLEGGDGDDLLWGDKSLDSYDSDVAEIFQSGPGVFFFRDHADAADVAGDDHLYGGAGNDGLDGGSGDDVLDGGTGDDVIVGGSGDDVLGGGSGSDLLAGGAGNDAYRFGYGDGADYVQDDEGSADRIVFGAGISTDDLLFSTAGADLQIRLMSRGMPTGDVLTLPGMAAILEGGEPPSASGNIELLEFADGTGISLADGVQAGKRHFGADAAGLTGGGTGDVYSFSANQFADGFSISISDSGGRDSVAIERQDYADNNPLTLSHLGVGMEIDLVSKEGDDMLLSLRVTSNIGGYPNNNAEGTLRLVDYFTDAGRIESVNIDGHVLVPRSVLATTAEEGAPRSYVDPYIPSLPNGVYEAYDSASHYYYALESVVMVGTDGADELQIDLPLQNWAINELHGHGGNDVLTGTAERDVLVGGQGDDRLEGGRDYDTYHINPEERDVVFDDERETGAVSIDSIHLPDGWQTDDVEFSRDHDDLLIGATRVERFFERDTNHGGSDPLPYKIEWLYGDDGRVRLDDAVSGLFSQVWGSEHDNFLYGGEGDHTFVVDLGNNGRDEVRDDGVSTGDTIILGTASTDVDLEWMVDEDSGLRGIRISDKDAPEHSVTVMLAGADSDPGEGVERFVFSDATLSRAELIALAPADPGLAGIAGTSRRDVLAGTDLADVINGLEGNDSINAGAGDDVIIGGAGRDVMDGGSGDDVFQVLGSDVRHDVFIGGEGFDRVLGSDRDDVIRVHRFSGDKRVEQVDGAGGYNVLAGTDANNLIDLSGVDLLNVARIEAGLGDDRIIGSSGGDVILGGPGRDVMKGADGDDLFLVEGFDTAHDVVNGGNGFDRITGSVTDDVIRLHRFRGDNRVEMIDGGGGVDVIMGTDADDRLDFRETELRGIRHIDAGQGDDVVFGSIGDDVLFAGAGDDRFVGGSGNDTYVFGRGDGMDVIKDRDRTPNTDRLLFGDDIDMEQIWFRRVGDDLEVSVIGGDDQATIENWFEGAWNQIEEFRTADGQSLLNSEVDNLINAMAAFSPPGSGELSLTPDYREELLPVIAASWQ